VLGTLLIVLVLYLPGGLASLVERRRPAAEPGGPARG